MSTGAAGVHWRGAVFYIWHPDVVSNEFYDALETAEFDTVRTVAGLEFCYSGPAPQLPKPAADRLSQPKSY